VDRNPSVRAVRGSQPRRSLVRSTSAARTISSGRSGSAPKSARLLADGLDDLFDDRPDCDELSRADVQGRAGEIIPCGCGDERVDHVVDVDPVDRPGTARELRTLRSQERGDDASNSSSGHQDVHRRDRVVAKRRQHGVELSRSRDVPGEVIDDVLPNPSKVVATSSASASSLCHQRTAQVLWTAVAGAASNRKDQARLRDPRRPSSARAITTAHAPGRSIPTGERPG
jgi:hypothetical protein